MAGCAGIALRRSAVACSLPRTTPGAARSALARAAAVTVDDDEDPVAAVATVSVAQR
jgi:Arc/MetJ family transcription regulator